MFEMAEATELDLVGRLVTAERTIAAAQAEQLALIAALHTRSAAWIHPAPGGCPEVSPVEVTAAEVATALRWSTLIATERVGLALDAATRLPRALTALAAGRLSLTKLRRLVDRTVDMTPEHATAVETAVLEHAAQDTPAQFAARLRRAVLRVDPAAATRRAERARRERGVDLWPVEDGMAVLRAVLSAAEAQRCHQALTERARADAAADRAAGIDDDRTVDARRADLLVEHLLGEVGAPTDTRTETAGTATRTGPTTAAGTSRPDRSEEESPGPAPGTPPADRVPGALAARCGRPSGRPSWNTARTQVHVTVPWTVLAGLSDDPAELIGYGPIDADTARSLAAEDAVWRRLLTHPVTGAVLDVGTTSYHPPAALEEFVRTRDRTCRFPGCRRTARRADLDHTIPHPHGPTSKRNLAALCRAHHRLKTHTRWRVEQHDDGRLEWTSPTGYTHTTEPPEAHPPDPDRYPVDGADEPET